MSYLLDTNACITYLNDRESRVALHLRQHSPTEVVVCSIVRAELRFGALRSRKPDAAIAGVMAFLAPFKCIAFDEGAADESARIRSELAAQGLPIGPNDILIADVAVSRGLTLVTHNVGEFRRVAGLEIEDWEVA